MLWKPEIALKLLGVGMRLKANYWGKKKGIGSTWQLTECPRLREKKSVMFLEVPYLGHDLPWNLALWLGEGCVVKCEIEAWHKTCGLSCWVTDTLKEYFSFFRSLWKHFRAVSLCLFLLVFPAYMAYMICQFFHMDFWLLIIISSSILTSLQVSPGLMNFV